jgi:predicted metal-dependent HD superfamily phosphohydrolase
MTLGRQHVQSGWRAMKTEADAAPRFRALWKRCVASPPSPDAASVFTELKQLLVGPGRLFHNLDHIRECVRRLDEVAPLLDDADAVEMAIWFHDAIYDPGDATNEWRSAELFLARSEGALPVFRRRVCALILTTRHATAARSSDRRFIDDIDLVGFAAPWDDFMHSGDLLRAEFAAHADAKYYASQAQFLARLQRRSRFFATDYFHDKYEARAQRNIQRLLDDLARRGYAANAGP